MARYFGKEHKHVLDAIDDLMRQMPGGGSAEFSAHPHVHPQNGQTYRSFDMDRDGFTGPRALQFKMAMA
ncbi:MULTISPECIES: Rha family transcriptional regulator [unclassified Xanthobacter]|uniref:Rha family transcriptional regulator n=1 Tax=unclassified Xanthobacter TaxID=2623496 RepID=UPI00307FD667